MAPPLIGVIMVGIGIIVGAIRREVEPMTLRTYQMKGYQVHVMNKPGIEKACPGDFINEKGQAIWREECWKPNSGNPIIYIWENADVHTVLHGDCHQQRNMDEDHLAWCHGLPFARKGYDYP